METSTLIEKLDSIREIYVLYTGIFNLTIGIVGNILSILVFTTLRVFKGNQSAFYMIIESTFDIGLLLVMYVSRLLTFSLGYNPFKISIAWCKIRSMILQVFGLCSLFSVSFLSFDQYLSTNIRSNWRKMSTLKLARHLTYVNVCFAIVHSTTFLFFTEIRSAMGCTVYNPTMQHYYSFFYYPIITSLLPLTTCFAFSILAYRNVRRIIQLRLPVIRRRLDRQMTAMTLARVMILIIFGIPFVGSSLYELNSTNSNDNYLGMAIYNLLSSICDSVFYANFSINFYAFLVVSSRFRRQVKNNFFRKCWLLIKAKRTQTQLNRARNQISPEIVQQSASANEL